jgi:HPt (histidine-containing phosphotransfer) domain-containing protein
MRSTEYRPRASAKQIVPEDPFDELRDVFHARLRSDQVRLLVLAASLACADTDPAPVFEDIRVFAHRVRGAAAVFGAADIGVIADALEQAAISAASAHAENSDPTVCTALEALAERLATVNDKAVASVPAGARRSRGRRKRSSA